MSEPEARLVYLFPGAVTFPSRTEDLEERSRLCEIQWVDRALFGNSKIVAVTQAFYGAASASLDCEVRPGALGEQMVFSDPISTCEKIRVGDAVFMVGASPNLSLLGRKFNLSDHRLWARELELLEEGLVEPGAPVTRV